MADTTEKLEVGDWRQWTVRSGAERWLKTLRENGYDGKLEDQGAQLYRFRVTVTAVPDGSAQ